MQTQPNITAEQEARMTELIGQVIDKLWAHFDGDTDAMVVKLGAYVAQYHAQHGTVTA